MICRVCKQDKLESDFGPRYYNGANGRITYTKKMCKQCDTQYCISRNRKLKQDLIDAYGGCCACCGTKEFEFLTLDHINGDGAQHRRKHLTSYSIYTEIRKLGYPKDAYRILCMNCNFSIGMYGYCPHTINKN